MPMTLARRSMVKGMILAAGVALAKSVRAFTMAPNPAWIAVLPKSSSASRAPNPVQSIPAKLGLFSNNILPELRMLSDMPLRDTSVCRGPDGTWYLTGTIPPFWSYNEGIKVWQSKDMKLWEPLGMVWRYGESAWHKKYLEAKRPLWAPEIHYLKGTFWLTYSLPGLAGVSDSAGCGLLRSTSGKAEGPYEDVQPSERLGDAIDASLFQDEDGAVYFLWHSGKIARMKDDMTGLAETYKWVRTTTADANPQHHSTLCAKIFGGDSFNHIGFEGAYIFKAKGFYYFSCAETWEGRYSCVTARSKNIYGPYEGRYESVPHAGHNVFFQDEASNWWSTYFGNDSNGAPWREKPGIVPIHFDPSGKIQATNSV
ncbi:MAG TPA: family 43 glycosylhydrolase [Acidobacteriaceae bacterium]|nr:family 43 glycosylhydrolase [Acidobacteriaceae bacterium]